MNQRTFVPWSDDDGEFRDPPDPVATPERADAPDSARPHITRDSHFSERTSRSWAFYLFSAALHLIAAFALSRSWMQQKASPAKTPSAPPPVVERAPVAKIEIDVAPVKYCELDIRSLTGQQPVISRLTPIAPKESGKSDQKSSKPRPRRRLSAGSGALSQGSTSRPSPDVAKRNEANEPATREKTRAAETVATVPSVAQSNLVQDVRP